MSQSTFSTRLEKLLIGLLVDRHPRNRRARLRRPPEMEFLEGRALLSTINASATISSAAAGANFQYTLTLNNSITSDSGIGTFWYAWVPGEDFLAAPPISVTLPAGWTDNITHQGSKDGYAIQFLASSPDSDVQPGDSLTFSFVSASTPAAISGNSVFFPSTPVSTSFVYPGAPFSDAGHQFVATSTSSTPATLVSVTKVNVTLNKKNMVKQITIDFSGALNMTEADSIGIYRLAMPGKKGSFTAKNAKVIKLKSAAFDGASDQVTLTPRTAFARTKPVQLAINGQDLEDSAGHLINGAGDNMAGSNFVTIFAATPPIAKRTPPPTPTPYPGY